MFPSTSNLPVRFSMVPKSPGCLVGEVGEGVKNTERNQESMAMLTNANVSGRVPIGPPCGRLLNQIDVLALRILSCAKKKHNC